jgi:GDP-4-dehydro-6-deoxy-D-mannose reductase
MTEQAKNDSNAVILVTGGTGFAGSHLIEELVAQGYSNIHTTSLSGNSSHISSLIGEKNIHQVDLTDPKATEELFATLKPSKIYHLAAFADVGGSFDQAGKMMENNTALQLNVLEGMRLHSPTARLLSVGSALQYGIVLPHETPVKEEQVFRPINPYAVSKVTQEMLSFMYSKSHSLNVVMARSFNHTGEYQTTAFAIPAFVDQIVKVEIGQQSVIKVGNLEAARDFSDVKDVAKAYVLLMEAGKSGEVYNIGSGVPVTMKHILQILSQLAKTPVKIEVDMVRFRPVDIPVMVADNQKIKALGWSNTIPLQDTLARVLEWYRSKI